MPITDDSALVEGLSPLPDARGYRPRITNEYPFKAKRITQQDLSTS